ncbi:hypothetical protein [Nocardia altamirensis]|uniref:hypothetical protein n=1 Tax=Nocardia altamirensis TaxID=472158 RepID=UPI00084063A6|nr:hypothetical protein [Nocardia altamirensis]
MFDTAEIRATYTGKYGTTEVGPAIDARLRFDRYTGHGDGVSGVQHIHTAGRTDISDEHSSFRAYDSKCGWCYLNAPHTENAHIASVDDAKAREQK